MYESLYAGATDIESLAVISDWSGVMSSGPISGEPVSVPSRRGAYYVAGEREPYTWDLPLSMYAASLPALHTKLSDLSALLAGPVTLKRRVSFTAGNTEQEARSVISGGWQPVYTGTQALRLSLAVTNLDGCWYSVTATTGTVTGSGSITVPGDLTTANATVTLSGGTDQRVTLGNGSWVQWAGSTGTTAVVIDCLNWTATQGGADVSGKLSHGGGPVTPLLFSPGVNTVTVTGGGSAALSVKGAWR